MKAITYTEYGPPEVLNIKEFDNPVPKENEILIKVKAGSVNYGDLLARNFGNTPRSEFNMPLLFWVFARMEFGISRPKIKILGSEYSGVVEDAGSKVSRFKKGDKVFGFTSQAMGANAQYLCVSENGRVATMPTGLTFEEAASIPYGALMASILLKKTKGIRYLLSEHQGVSDQQLCK